MAEWTTSRGAVSATIDALSYEEFWKPDGNGTTALFTIPYANRETFVKCMLGQSIVGNNNGLLNREVPQQCDGVSWVPQYCVACDLVKAYGSHDSSGSRDWINFSKAQYRCTFQSVPYRILPNDQITEERERYVIRKRRTISREQKIPGGGFEFSDTGERIAEVGFRVNVEVELQYTWLKVPVKNVPYASMLAAVGTVNDASFNDYQPELNYVMDAGTLLYKGTDEKTYYDAGGVFCSDLTHCFGWRANTWNKFPDSKGVMRTIRSVTSNLPLYSSTDFNLLFRPVN